MSQGEEVCPPSILEGSSVVIAKIKSLCDKIATDVADSISDPTVISVFNDICEAVRLISKTTYFAPKNWVYCFFRAKGTLLRCGFIGALQVSSLHP